MSAYWFRFVNDEGEPTGYMGLAVARTQDELFWQIDEFGDPYSVELLPVTRGGMCWKDFKIPEGEDEGFDREEHEVSEMAPDPFEDKGWVKPEWCESEEAALAVFERLLD